MSLITIILSTLVAATFFFIFYLETLNTTSLQTSKVFNMSQEELARPALNVLFKNQGVYNLLIGVFILIALFIVPNKTYLGLLFGYIILVAAYGTYSSRNFQIFIKQAGIAVIALVSLFF